MISLNYNLIIEMVLFLVMMFVLSKYLIWPLVRVMEARDEKILSTGKKADELERDAQARISEYETRMEQARKKAGEERESIKKAAYSQEEDMLKQARTESANAIAELRESIAAEYREASRRLAEESEKISKDIAEKILGRSLS